MALVMTEEKHIIAPNGERKILKVGEAVPKDLVAAWTGKPFVKDTDAKKAEKEK
jgi:hypothetical protein